MQVSKENFVSISNVYCGYHILRARLSADVAIEMYPSISERDGEDWIEVEEMDLHPSAAKLRADLRNDVEAVFDTWSIDQWEAIKAAAILDPRHKNLNFIEEKDRAQV